MTLFRRAPIRLRVGNWLYHYAFPVYRPLYRLYKLFGDRGENGLIRSVISGGNVVVDAGANIGIYSEFFSNLVGSEGSVHSFEPSPDNYARLVAVTKHLSNVYTNQVALGDRTGPCDLYISDELNVDHRTYRGSTSRRAIKVKGLRLEDYFKPGQRVDFIKLDTQGYELHVLRGAQRVIADNPDIKLLVEFWPYGLRQAGADWKELWTMLHDHGMVVRRFCAGRLERFAPERLREDEDAYENIFAARAGAV